MPSSSSSSSSAKKKSKKKGKDKDKDKSSKKQKKEAKKEKKQKQRAERAQLWECDRAAAVRLLAQLLLTGPGIVDELKGLFSAIDEGGKVSIDGLEDKHVKKKLRHLLQALRLKNEDGQGFCTADEKVSFEALFQECLKKAQPPPPEPTVTHASEDAEIQEDPCEVAPDPAPAPEVGGGKRLVGPRLPMPTISSDGMSKDGPGDDDEEDADGGPKLEGAERRGVDLDTLGRGSRREAWMTTPHESIAGAFAEGATASRKNKDRFEVKRSREESDEFEKAMEARGPSLLQQTMEGNFQGGQEAAQSLHKKLKSAQGVWGTGANEGAKHRPFDPEQDLTVTKPITGGDFTKLVENSATGLLDRFKRGAVASSFL